MDWLDGARAGVAPMRRRLHINRATNLAQQTRPAITAGRWDLDRLSLAITITFGIVCGLMQASGRITRPYDFDFYWRATDFGNLYPANWMDPTYAYVYPPVLAQLLYPFHLLPYAVVQPAWTVLCFASLWYCLGRWSLIAIGLGFVGILLPPNNPLGAFLGAALVGNAQLPLAAAIVLGMRHPGWFAVPILTKLTTGIGLAWFAFRGEWRRFAIGVGVTLSIVAISFVVSPGAWIEWARFSIDNFGGPSSPPIIGPPLVLRVIGATALTWYAARTDRAWLVPLACGIAIPGLYGIGSVLTIAGGAVRLARPART